MLFRDLVKERKGNYEKEFNLQGTMDKSISWTSLFMFKHLFEVRQRKTNTVWPHLHVKSKQYNKRVNITKKKKQDHWYRKQTSGLLSGATQGWGWEVKTTGYKDVFIAQGTQPVFYNNYKWSVHFKNYIRNFKIKAKDGLGQWSFFSGY